MILAVCCGIDLILHRPIDNIKYVLIVAMALTASLSETNQLKKSINNDENEYNDIILNYKNRYGKTDSGIDKSIEENENKIYTKNVFEMLDEYTKMKNCIEIHLSEHDGHESGREGAADNETVGLNDKSKFENLNMETKSHRILQESIDENDDKRMGFGSLFILAIALCIVVIGVIGPGRAVMAGSAAIICLFAVYNFQPHRKTDRKLRELRKQLRQQESR